MSDNTPLKLPSQEELLSLLRYEPETGKLFWRERSEAMFDVKWQHKTWNSRWSGKEAFTSLGDGYKRGSLFGQFVFAHRIIWKMVYGEDPGGQIDHLNGDRADNRLQNLRVVDDAGNRKNQSIPKDNTSGRIGVHWHRAAKKWAAGIFSNGKSVHLGVFADFDDAVRARTAAEREFGFHENHGKINPYQGV